MENIPCIIIDDEPIARNYLSDYVTKMPQLELLATFNKATDAYSLIESGKAMLIFLDIQMPGLTGIEFIRTLQKKPAIILTTAYSEYALESYELDVLDYLLKPISFERFAKAVNKAAQLLQFKTNEDFKPVSIDPNETINVRDFIFVKSGYKSVKVSLTDVLFIEGMKEYVVIYTSGHKYTKLDRMKNIEIQLRGQGFIRIHKSYIVSVKQINAVYGNTVEINGEKLPLGRSFKEAVYMTLGINE